MMRTVRQLAIPLAASLATVGCASTPPAPDAGAQPERAPAPVVRETPTLPATTPVRASFEYSPGTASYIVVSDVTISASDTTMTPRQQEYREVVYVSFGVATETGENVVTTTGSIFGLYPTRFGPFVDTLRMESGDSVAEPRMPICGRDTVPPMHLVTLLPPVPLQLSEGLRWQRRRVYAICQGSIPVRIERTDSYTVTGRAPDVAGSGVTLSRNSSLSYTGSGVEGQHNVDITGTGSAQATLVLDASAGRLVSSMEEASSEIDVTASEQTRRFSQRVVKTVKGN